MLSCDISCHCIKGMVHRAVLVHPIHRGFGLLMGFLTNPPSFRVNCSSGSLSSCESWWKTICTGLSGGFLQRALQRITFSVPTTQPWDLGPHTHHWKDISPSTKLLFLRKSSSRYHFNMSGYHHLIFMVVPYLWKPIVRHHDKLFSTFFQFLASWTISFHSH